MIMGVEIKNPLQETSAWGNPRGERQKGVQNTITAEEVFHAETVLGMTETTGGHILQVTRPCIKQGSNQRGNDRFGKLLTCKP